jgi:hypothetical protein
MLNNERKRKVSIARVPGSPGTSQERFNVKPKTPWNTFFTGVDVDRYPPKTKPHNGVVSRCARRDASTTYPGPSIPSSIIPTANTNTAMDEPLVAQQPEHRPMTPINLNDPP